MTSQLDISIEGHLGVIALNRPEAINALSRQMIDGIRQTLNLWHIDPQVRAILFEGRGEKGFCAGGDIKATRSLLLAGRGAEAEAYFAAEYKMNEQIGTYSKPVIALSHGVVMGGGIGIAGHAGFRFTTTDARFAMPEAGIGFFCDIGVNWILGKTPLNRALLFLLSGATVGAGDALALGLADCAILPTRRAALRAALVAAAGEKHVADAVGHLMAGEAIEPGAASLCAVAAALPDAPSANVAAFLKAVEMQAQATKIAALLATRSPTSLATIFLSQLRARQLPDLAAVLRLDLRLAIMMANHPDFAEGVRALLVDRDRAPHWIPDRLAGVDQAGLMALMRA